MSQLLIGLTGLAGAGKDTVRAILEKNHDAFGLAFADPMRDMLGALLESIGLSSEWMTERHLKELVIPELGTSYREMAQRLGTEWGRAIGEDFWLRIASAKVQMYRQQGDHIVISDVRFPNEAAWIQAQGGVVWRILRPGLEAVRSHASEMHFDHLPYDYTILNQGSLEELDRAVRCALTYHRRWPIERDRWAVAQEAA